MKPEIFILTGQIQSGKTSRLTDWISTKTNCGGVLSPVINGKRYLVSISGQTSKLLEASPDKTNTVKIGKNIFSVPVMEWGKNEIRSAWLQNKEWIIVDEVGPLELAGKGFEPEITKLIQNKKTGSGPNIILVIRQKILEQALQYLNISTADYSICDFI